MDLIKELGEIALGSRLKRISDRINQEISKIFKSQNINIEPSLLPVLLYLNENESASVQELASALNFTHPAVIHLLKQMSKRDMVDTFADRDDGRKRMIRLSGNGKKILDSAEDVLDEIRISVKELVGSPGYDFMVIMDQLEKTLNEKTLIKRTEERIKQKLMSLVDILKFTPAHKEQFKLLNLEWLEKYFKVESEDERILNNPESIVSDGGEIFFASLNNEIIGTCAVIKKNAGEFELAKMAVAEKAQGKQAGKKLALAAIGFAYSNGAKSLVLETSRKLPAAVGLYERLGFEYLHDNPESKFERATFKMKLDLTA